METSFRRLMSLRETVLSELPDEQRSHHLHAFKEGFEQLVKIDMASLTPMPISSAAADQTPQAVKRLAMSTTVTTACRVSGTRPACFFVTRRRRESLLTPIWRSTRFRLSPRHFAILMVYGMPCRELDAEACTGCGACWTLCPDGAIGVSLMDPAMLLETGVRMTGSDRLRPILSKLSISMIRRCREKGNTLTTAGELLHDTFDWLLQQSLPENHKQHAAEAKS